MRIEIFNPERVTSIKVAPTKEGQESEDVNVIPIAEPADVLSGYDTQLYRIERRVGERVDEPEVSYAVVGKVPGEPFFVGDKAPGGRRPIVIEVSGIEEYFVKGEDGEDEERFRLISPTNPTDIYGIDPAKIDERVARLIKEDMDHPAV